MPIDDIDAQIITILRSDARTPTSQIARSVGLSPAPVARRIERLEREGVILGYAALIDDRRANAVEAFTELRLTGATETGQLDEIFRHIPEVEEFYTIAGDADVLVRLRVEDVDHLQRVVNAMRRTGRLTSSRTMIVMHTWNRRLSRTAAPDRPDGRGTDV